MRTFTLLFLLFFYSKSFTQTKNLDSLYQEAKKIKNDSLRLNAEHDVAFRYIFSQPDSAIVVINRILKYAKANNEDYHFTRLTNTKGIYFDVTGISDSAQFYFEKALKLSRDNNFDDLESRSTNNLGMMNWNRGRYSEALSFFFESLKMDEKRGDIKSSAKGLNNIGLIYQEMKLNEKALEYHRKALKIREDFNLKNDQIASLNNIGINLKELQKYDEAIAVYKQGITIAKSQNNLVDYYRLVENLANVYNLQNNIPLAIKTYEEALDRPKDFKADEHKMYSVYNNLAALYNSVNEPKKALEYIKEGFDLLDKFKTIDNTTAEFYLHSAETNYMLGNYELAREQSKRFVALKDSIFSLENAKAIADLDVKYETEKKERQILEQRTKIAENELIIQKRNYQLYGALGLALVFGLMGYLFFNQQKIKNKQLEKEAELKDALVKIETQNKLQEQRLRISRDLHDNIGAQLTFIISSIDNLKYGDKLTKKIENKLSAISDFTSNTILELRDTIWAMNKDEITFEDLQTRIANYIEKANISAKNIEFDFNVSENLDTTKVFSSVEGMNIYRIIQEAINNSIKYAEASKIRVLVTEQNQNLSITIEDDGKGFEMSNVTLGNGISNMKNRAEELRANFSLNSTIDEGTKVCLILNHNS